MSAGKLRCDALGEPEEQLVEERIAALAEHVAALQALKPKASPKREHG